jgi:uncharacterized protein
MKPTYFDLSVHDVAAARCFFESALGWQFERFPFPYEYYRITAGPAGEAGIDGGIAAVADAPLSGSRPMTQMTVEVPDLDAAIARVTRAGGRVVEPRVPIPGVGWYATCAEPGGLMFGLVQSDPAATPG